jgi:uncharacterized membrane protein
VYTIFLLAASFFTVWGLSADLVNYFDNRNMANAKNLSLTGFWAAYASVLLAAGIIRRSRTLRLASLVLLFATIVKVFAYDVFALERLYRIVAFVGLGLLLLGGKYVYQRYGKAIRGFIVEG